jgi:hypothetical protein
VNVLFRHLEGRHPEGCLTLYLPAGPGFDPGYYDGLLKDAERALGSDPGVARELVAVREFIGRVRPPGLPLAIFTCSPAGIFDARRLPEDVELRFQFGERFDLNQLASQLDRHPPGVVAVVGKDEVRLFGVVLEDVQPIEDVEGETVVRDVRPDNESGWPRQQAYDNLKHAVDVLMNVASAKRGFEAIYLAGPEEPRSRFRKLLPKPAQARVRAEFGVQPSLGPSQLADQIRRRE